jgi:hypothetical protein
VIELISVCIFLENHIRAGSMVIPVHLHIDEKRAFESFEVSEDQKKVVLEHDIDPL